MAAIATFHKASASDDPVVAVAARLEGKFRDAYLEAVDTVKAKISLAEIREGIEQGNIGAIERSVGEQLGAVFRGTGMAAETVTVIELVERTFREAAKAAMTKLPLKIEEQLSFNLLNPRSVDFLQQYEFELIREISTGTAEAIRNVMLRAFQDGIPPREAAREIRQVIGLTSRQTQAVGNFQRALAESTPDSLRQILERELRDRRHDATIRRAIEEDIVLTREQIQTMTERYYQRFLRHRAEMIARTETIRASSAGQHALFLQAEEQGLINRQAVQRKWVVSGDERTCEICNGLNGQKTGLNEPFPGGYFYPPDPHPSCRCSVVLTFTR